MNPSNQVWPSQQIPKLPRNVTREANLQADFVRECLLSNAQQLFYRRPDTGAMKQVRGWRACRIDQAMLEIKSWSNHS